MNEPDLEFLGQMAAVAPADDGPLWMVNLIRYHERAQYPDGYDEMDTDVSGAEADARYAPLDILADIGAEVVFMGEVEDQLLGAAPPWDRVAVVRYPSRRAFVEMGMRPDYQARLVHKQAAIDATIVSLCHPQPDPLAGTELVPWSEVAHPPTDDDGYVHVVHVVQFADRGDAVAELGAYSEAAGKTAVPHGVRVAAWFDVEGSVLHDGRRWDQVRFNVFPSKAAFMAVVLDPARLEAQAAHREPSMADTYTMIVRPVIDRLADSIVD